MLSLSYIDFFFLLLNLSSVAVETDISRCPFIADCFWLLLLIFQNAVKSKSDTEILCIVKQMCRLTKACTTDWAMNCENASPY